MSYENFVQNFIRKCHRKNSYKISYENVIRKIRTRFHTKFQGPNNTLQIIRKSRKTSQCLVISILLNNIIFFQNFRTLSVQRI